MAVYDCKECGYVIVLNGRISGTPCPKHRAELEAEFGKQFIRPLDVEEQREADDGLSVEVVILAILLVFAAGTFLGYSLC